MKIKEVSQIFNVDLDILQTYEELGFFDDVNRINGIREYEDKDIKILSDIITLEKLGISTSDISRYIELIKNGDTGENERIRILNKRRKVLLDEIHNKQKNINDLDCLIYIIQDCEYKAKEKK